jgi:hypothetical protein
LFGYEEKTLLQINDELAIIKSNTDSLKDLLTCLRRFAELPTPLQNFIRKLPVTVCRLLD